jgi:hypothetical protein
MVYSPPLAGVRERVIEDGEEEATGFLVVAFLVDFAAFFDAVFFFGDFADLATIRFLKGV